MMSEREVKITVTFDAAERLELITLLSEFLRAYNRESYPAAYALRDHLNLCAGR